LDSISTSLGVCENVRSISHILTSTSFPASANVLASPPVDERQSKGEGTTRERIGEVVSEGWKVSCPDVSAEIVPLVTYPSAFIDYTDRNEIYEETGISPAHVAPF
jgi:hypothetical protein